MASIQIILTCTLEDSKITGDDAGDVLDQFQDAAQTSMMFLNENCQINDIKSTFLADGKVIATDPS